MENRGGGLRGNASEEFLDEITPLLRTPEPAVGDASSGRLDDENSDGDSISAPTPDTTDAESFGEEADGDILQRTTSLTAIPILEPEVVEAFVPAHHDRRHQHAQSTAPGDEGEEGPLLPGGLRQTPYLNNLSPRRVHVIFTLILLTYFVACFDGTIMASSHPVITSYFRGSNSASWLSTSFLLASTAVQPLLGRLSDATGRKLPYVAGIVVFALGTTWCALAGSMGSFIAARAVCGVGAGGMMSLGGIIVSDMVPIERRGTFQSLFNVTYGIGSALGVALGGLMADYLGWRWEFGIQVFPILMALTIAILVIPNTLGKQNADEDIWDALRMFDFKGSALLTTSVTCFVLGMNLGGNVLPWNHPMVITSLCIVAVGFPAFLYTQSLAVRPIMPLRLLGTSPRGNLIFANFLGAILTNAIFFNVPLFFQAVLLTSATASGLHLIVPTLFASLTGTSTGLLITYTRRLKWPLVLGTSFFLAGTLLLSRILRRGWPEAVYLLILLPCALGQGFQFPGTVMALLASSPQHEQAVVSSALILWRSLGAVLGVAASSLVLQNALAVYLKRFVEGPRREEVITLVRKSVEAVAKLEGPYQEMAVRSYEKALGVTFLACAGLAAVSVLLILPIRLERLRPQRG